MKENPSPKQTLLLWRILAFGGAAGKVMQKDLKVKVAASDRRRLIQFGLLEVAKGKAGALQLTVTDDGWAWADEHLDANLPAKAGAGMAPLLQKWLTLFHEHLRRHGASLADVFGTAKAPESPSADAVHARVRSEYLALTGGRLKTRCLLRDLRNRLRDVSREILDSAIRKMVSTGEAVLFRLDNRLEITPADIESSILSGGEQQHILWIDR